MVKKPFGAIAKTLGRLDTRSDRIGFCIEDVNKKLSVT